VKEGSFYSLQEWMVGVHATCRASRENLVKKTQNQNTKSRFILRSFLMKQ